MKKIQALATVWLGVLILCFGSVQTVSAQNTLQIGIDQYEVTDEGKISVFVNQNEADGFTPSKTDSTLLIGKNPLQIEDIKSFRELKEPITYLCLVDISGSMTEDGITQTKNVLRQLVEAKDADDNFCITTMGNDVKSSGFLSDQEKLAEMIEGIERVGTEDTNLYYSINEALNELKTDKAVHKKRCLVIFSDGEDDQKKGITRKEAEDAVKESHIPVFTVMLTGNKLKDAEESVKILGSFARSSAGGEHYAPPLETDIAYEDICDMINIRLKSSVVVVVGSLEEIKEVGDDTVYIGVTLSDGKREASDGITVPAGTILEAIEALDEARKAADVKVTVVNENNGNEKEEAPVPEKKLAKKYVVGIAALVLVLLIALLTILVRKNGENRYDEAPEEDDYAGRALAEAAENSSYGSVTVASEQVEMNNTQGVPGKGKDRVRITLFQIGPGAAENHKLTVKDRVTIGRDRNCQLSLPNDTALSGRHCSILYRDGSVYVRDENSTNGTFVNGVPIVGEYKVEMDDILLLGSSEYRITWE